MKMARGGHHGGGFHSGGHHGGGGFSGGGFRGGFSGGGGYRSGGHYHSRSYGGGSDTYDTDLMAMFIPSVILIGAVILGVLQLIANCFDVIKIVMLVISGIIFFIAKKKSGYVGAIQDLKSSKQCTMIGIFNGDYLSGNYGRSDGTSWYSDKNFCLVLDKRECRRENIEFVHNELKNWPFVLKISDAAWYISSIALFIVNVFFYELVIPLAENSVMSDEAFAFVDELIYYLPIALILLNSIACLVISVLRLKMAFKMCKKLVDSRIAEKMIGDTEKEIEIIYESFWFYDICPNCGYDAGTKDERCKSCGSSLKVKDLKNAKKKKEQIHQIEKAVTVEK